MEVELIDITGADQEEANCEEVIAVAPVQHGPVVGTLEVPTTPHGTTAETTVEAPAAAPPSPLKEARGCYATSQIELIPINKDSFILKLRQFVII